MEEDDLEEMRALRKAQNYQRGDSVDEGPRKKIKTTEDENDEAELSSWDLPIQFGVSKKDKNVIISLKDVSKDEKDHEEEEDESSEDYGPMPPPAQQETEPSKASSSSSSSSSSSQFDNYRKRKVIRVLKKQSETVPVIKKKTEAIYVYGKDDIPNGTQSTSSHEDRVKRAEAAVPVGDFDLDVLLDQSHLKSSELRSIPCQYEAFLRNHTKAVSAIDVDPSGTRLISGASDFTLKFWDFPSMDKSLQSFRSLEPCENSVINTASFSKTGDKILLTYNSPQAKILDREGRVLHETPRGYQFANDMTHTTGHTSPITRAVWHPNDAHSFITGAMDSTVRIWDMENLKKHKTLIKIKTDRGMNTCRVQTLTISNSNLIAVAGEDASIQLFPAKGPHIKPSIRISVAHGPGTDTSALLFSEDEKLLISRGGDDTLKIFDLRNTKSPLKVFDSLYNRYTETSLVWSPLKQTVVTGTSSSRDGNPGSLFFVDINTLETRTIEVSSESVISINWNPINNQILAGCGDGAIHALFNPETSQKGVLTALNKGIRKIEAEIAHGYDIITPLAMELNERQRKAAARKDPALSHKPQYPVSGSGSQGLLGTNLKADFMKKIMAKDGRDIHEDPREALLRHAGKESLFGLGTANPLDYEGLERLNQAEQKRAEELEKIRKQRERQ